MEKNKILRVNPDSIIFRDLKVGESDALDIWAHNAGKTPIQLRFILPPKSPFQLMTDSASLTAPGLDSMATIKYTAKKLEVVRETLKIACPTETIEVPITVFPPCPRIMPEKTAISLGNVGYQTDFKFSFNLNNIGIVEGTFSVFSDDGGVTFIPNNGIILPGKSVEVSTNFHPKTLGDYSFVIHITAENNPEPISPINVTAKSVQNSLSLQMDNVEVSEFDFNTIFFGQKRVITATIVNRGPYKRSFVNLPPKNSPIDSPSSHVSAHFDNPEDVVFTAVPTEGLLNPYSSQEIKFIFNPPIEKPLPDDLESVFNHYSAIEVVETGQKIDFTLNGKAVHHMIKFSEIDFIFERCDVNKKVKKVLTIENLSHFLPTSFEIQPIAHFRFEPSKGSIPANSKKDINIIFFPKNLGVFETIAKISFNNGLLRKHVNLSGACGNEEKPFKRIPVWEREKDAMFNAKHPDPRFSYGLDQIKDNLKKREKFDAYITDSAAEREKIEQHKLLLEHARKDAEHFLSQTVGNFTEADIDEYIQTHGVYPKEDDEKTLGLAPKDGLTPPDPPINTKPAPLYLQNPVKFGLAVVEEDNDKTDLSKRTKLNIDENTIIKKKFKYKATTPAEINECTRPLTPAQQLMVVASQQSINAGQISVFGTVVKSFTITNNLQQHIIVSLNYEYEELSQSSPASQVIPPKQTAGFDIKFTSKKPQNFMKSIQYTVNGHHTYSFNFIAQVIPIEVQINQSLIEFRFSPDSIMPVIKEFVTLQNKSNARAEYSFNGLSPPFSMQQSHGYIEANKSMNVEIVYSPGNRSHDEQDLILNIQGGPSRALKLIGDTGFSRCSLQRKSVNFGLIPIGIAKTQTLRLKNSGEDDAIFSLSFSNPNELQITPLNGRVSSHDSVCLQITYKSIQAHAFDIPVTISICGSQPLSLNVTGQSELPKIHLHNTEFEFGRVFVGSSSSIDAEISNVGSIPAILFLDLQNHPEFRIEFPTEYSENGTVELVSDPCFITKMESTHEYISRNTSIISSISTSLNVTQGTTNSSQQANKRVPKSSIDNAQLAQQEDDTKTGLIYKMSLAENASFKFSLIFQPIEVCDISFELPITMMNVLSSSSFHLQPIVSAEGVQAPLTLSTNALDFGVAPLYDSSNPNSRAVIKTFSILNEGKSAMIWYLTDLDETEVFVVEPMSGELSIGANQIVHVSFKPNRQTPYNTHLSLYVKSEKDNSIIGQVQLTGVGSGLPFRISHTDICLPVAPLNTAVQMKLYVINQAFIETLLKVQMACDEARFPVRVVFPEGNMLQHTTEKIPIVITFQCSHPLSFSTLVAIVDDAGNAASFSVSCTTDNSCFTLYPYLLTPKKKANAVNFKTCELPSRFTNASDFIELKNVEWEPKCTPLMIEFFQRYLNALVLTTQLSNFPDDFIASHGALLLEAVSNLTGSKKNITDDRLNTPEKRYEAMKKLLHSLISSGALLSSIKPEFLLSRTDFMYLMRQKVTKQLLGIDYFNAPEQSSFDQQTLSEFLSSKSFSNNLVKRLKILENLFTNLSIESWMMVLMQVFKLFVISRIDVDKFGSTPGVKDAITSLKNAVQKYSNANDIMNEINKPPKAINNNICYSPAEMTMLKWSALHFVHVTGDYNRHFSDYTSLTDGAVIASLIKAHTSFHVPNLNLKASDGSQKEQNAIELVNSMKSLKLSFCPQAREISRGIPCMLAVTLGYLYDILPHYIPQAVLDFSTTLHKEITKYITLTNPSKSEIIYKASFEGNNNFDLPEKVISVSAGQTAEFPVLFHARTIKPVSGRLSLIPSRPRLINATASNINLMNNNDVIFNANDPPQSERKSQAPRLPQFSAPVVVDVISAVQLNTPDKSLEMEGPIYQPTRLSIKVSNKLKTPSKISIYSKIIKIEDESGRPVQGLKSLQQQMLSFINSPREEKIPANPENFDAFIKNHQMLLLSTNSITFADAKSSTNIELEFIPITLGTFRILLLFSDESIGEFIYEITAKSTIPSPVDIPSIQKLKVESNKKISMHIALDLINSGLMHALAYSIEKRQNIGQNVSDRKIKDFIQRRQREIESQFKMSFNSRKFNVVSSAPQYFDIAPEAMITKAEGSKNANTLHVLFKPTKAGEYPCKILLMSHHDIRSFVIKGIGLAATKELSLDFQTVSGKVVKQEIPLQNVSNDTWQYKISISGDQSFSVPPRVTVKPNSFVTVPVTFTPNKIGQFNCEIQLYNLNKESTVIYNCNAVAEEPPTEDKIVINCQAREKYIHNLEIKPFVKNGQVSVTSTIPILSFPDEITFVNGQPASPFSFSILAPRSGIAAGTLTFTDKATKNYIWYVIEINVDSPKPEQTINVNTIARKSVTVSIPIHNPKNVVAKFKAQFMDDDLFGEKEFVVNPNSSIVYTLVVSPLRAMKKMSAVYFYSDDDGEFWYCIKIEAEEPPENTLAPMSAPIGKYMSTFIQLDNPSSKPTNYRVDNDNGAAFQVIAKRVITLGPREKKRVEIRYIPTSVGMKETASISFKSADTGDWLYKLTGTGKPPQPLSPTIVTTSINSASSALILFKNPFPYPAKFNISMTMEGEEGIFQFLNKRKVFTLNNYNEECQIPFTFTPKSLGQFKGHIVVASLGPVRMTHNDENLPNIRWVFPIIGNALNSDTNDIKTLRCRAHESIEHDFKFTLIGETETFQFSEYSLNLSLPNGFEFIRSVLDMKVIDIEKGENSSTLNMKIKFAPRRPLKQRATLTVRNPLGQEWQFIIDLTAELGKILEQITIESLLNKTGKAKIQLNESFRSPTPFHAYFTSSSASEFSVVPEHGLIEPTLLNKTELPLEIIFAPKMYGKVLKGILVIDTIEAQFLFDVFGKTPEYVPPVVSKSLNISSNSIQPQKHKAATSMAIVPTKHRNIIRENIERARIVKPRVKSVMGLPPRNKYLK
ncbi:hypothetical protein TRFO_17376 [Tritrichomonas foetus]|uniref:Calponin-homology (CH) domain-containing protein n=1 Tax=Tritrichomonas foetus TaxID=1144522 RepID=A0A1J4KN47_9EUKA|nr:hypothetical protein TRFO_17376 [Tritrichomonas foetus]|eukprot:OHT12743.1 hypothetical protein TRFO_17376 [Tritrichomonas foetus]